MRIKSKSAGFPNFERRNIATTVSDRPHDRDPPPRGDPRRRRGRLVPPDGRGRSGTAHAVSEHSEAAAPIVASHI